MSADVTPNFKENVGECGCGCGAFGTLRSKPWRSNNVTCVRRVCSCKQCTGKKARDKGDSKARRARKTLAIPGANTRHEELWGGQVRAEMKSGAQVRPAVTAFVRMERQSEQERPLGDGRPFVGVALPDGSSDGIVMFRLSQIDNVLVGLAEQRGLIA